jgi:hypothetical protein
MHWKPAKYVAQMRVLRNDHNSLILKTNMNPPGTAEPPGVTTACTKRTLITPTSSRKWQFRTDSGAAAPSCCDYRAVSAGADAEARARRDSV